MNSNDLVSLVHLGCARNLIDSELMLARMAEENLVVTGDPSAAHTVVLNTCSFIGPAREESEGAIRDLVGRKERGEIQRVVVAGCLVQRYRDELQARFPKVDLFAEISDYRELARSVRSMADGAGFPAYLAAAARGDEREGSRLLATPRSYAYLRISHGCDHTCSFCAIPSIRGPHRSKRPVALVGEAEELAATGVRELVIVAEDATAWGRDIGMELPELIAGLAEVEGIERVRIMYAYPNRFPWELTGLLRDHPNVVPYLDIPVQHAATPVLRAMRRAGSGDQVRAILDRLRNEVPGITLRTTLLMGFPGETDADAEEAVRLVRDYEIGRVGVFTYSPEEGTPGYDLTPRVSAKVATERARAIELERDRVLAEGQRALVGTELEVLVDEVHPLEVEGEVGQIEAEAPAALAVGRGAMDAPEVDLVAEVSLPGIDAVDVGDLVRVRVEALDEESNLVCRLVDAVKEHA